MTSKRGHKDIICWNKDRLGRKQARKRMHKVEPLSRLRGGIAMSAKICRKRSEIPRATHRNRCLRYGLMVSEIAHEIQPCLKDASDNGQRPVCPRSLRFALR